MKLNRDPSDPLLKTKTRTETIIAPCSPTCIRILTCGKRRPRAPSRFWPAYLCLQKAFVNHRWLFSSEGKFTLLRSESCCWRSRKEKAVLKKEKKKEKRSTQCQHWRGTHDALHGVLPRWLVKICLIIAAGLGVAQNTCNGASISLLLWMEMWHIG